MWRYVCYIKLGFYSLTCLAVLNQFILVSWFHSIKQPPEILNLQMEMLLKFKNAMSIEIIRFSLIHLAFAVDLS